MLKKLFVTLTIIMLLGSNALASPFKDGLFAFYDGDYTRALELWKPLARNGHAKAQYHIGIFYKDGLGVEQDLTKAAKLLQMAAEQDDTEALIELGNMYAYNVGVKRDYARALEYYRLATELGNYGVLSVLGYMYENGEGLEQNLELSYVWFTLAVELNNTEGDEEGRDGVGTQLTSKQIENAETLAYRCFYSSFSECEAW